MMPNCSCFTAGQYHLSGTCNWGCAIAWSRDPRRQGLAPQWFEIDLAAFVSDDGDLTARLEVEYDLLLTQRLILQPRVELDSESKTSALDLRVRYEIKREIAPYIGVSWTKTSGREDYISLVAGARFWF